MIKIIAVMQRNEEECKVRLRAGWVEEEETSSVCEMQPDAPLCWQCWPTWGSGGFNITT